MTGRALLELSEGEDPMSEGRNTPQSTVSAPELEALLEIAFNLSPDAAQITRLSDGAIVHVNEGVTTMLGIPREEILGKTTLELEIWADPADRQRVIDAIQAEGQCRGHEVVFKRRGGGQFVGLLASRRFSYRGEPHLITLTRDITERKRAEAALAASERKWRQILVNTPQIGISLDPRARIVFANAHFLKLTGWTEEEVLGQDWIELFIPVPIREQVRGVFAQVMSSRDTSGFTSFQNEIVTRTGELRDVVWSNVLTLGNDGAILDVTCLGVDVTERERAAQALRENEEKFRSIAEQLSDLVAITDAAGVVVYASPSSTALFGIPPEKMCGRHFTSFLEEEDVSAALGGFRSALAENQPTVALELRMRRRDGSSFIGELNGVPHRFGDEPGTLVTIRDISERKRAEDERRKLQADLHQAQKMEAIGTLAGGVAHDFNNILGGILGGLSLLELELGEKAEHLVDIQEMKGLVERGAELAKQLLGFARRGKYDVRPLDLARVLERTSAMFGRTRRDITILRDLAPDLPPVLMDHAQLEQVLLNLFLNAGQAMPDGGRLLLRAERAGSSEDPLWVRLMISDSGIGMDATTRARLFEPFFTTKGPGNGTGLGLASVYGIVQSHGGRIEVESAPGQGATFTLLLPATDRPLAKEKVPAAPLASGKGTVLVVDDEDSIRRVCSRLLEKLGYQVLTAVDGEQAIERVRERSAELALVILDLTMPGMGGARTYDALREIAPGLKVLLASGFSAEGQAQAILARGCNGFLQKPFTAATLSAKLRELLD